MRLLLDTHVLLAGFEAGFSILSQTMRDLLEGDGSELTVSAASLWEICIKVRAGKLDLDIPLDALPPA